MVSLLQNIIMKNLVENSSREKTQIHELYLLNLLKGRLDLSMSTIKVSEDRASDVPAQWNIAT